MSSWVGRLLHRPDLDAVQISCVGTGLGVAKPPNDPVEVLGKPVIVEVRHDPLYERATGFLTRTSRIVDQKDFERLYSEHARPLLDFLFVRTGDRQLAEDLLADTFERVLRARRPFRARPGGASEKTWLYTIALNRLRDEIRRTAVEDRALARVPGESAHPGAALDAIADREVVAAALRTLSDEEREAVALRFGADLTVPEIARLLGISLTTAEGRVYRALRKLRPRLEPPDGG